MEIVLENLTKRYEAVTALPPLSARLPIGETTCVLGPSGCGKTTLFRLLMGLEMPSGGRFYGIPKSVSAVFQEDRLLPKFSAVTNIRLATGNRVTEEEIYKVLEELGLSHWEKTPAEALSGGMGRRVSIARALLYPAEAVLMDEPFKGLDEKTKERVMDCVKRRTRGKTLLLITHEEREAAVFGGHVLRMGKDRPLEEKER